LYYYFWKKSPEVEYCGYSIPHPSEDRLNIRIQTTGKVNNILIHVNHTSMNWFKIIWSFYKFFFFVLLENTTAVDAMRKGLEDLK